MQVKNTSPYGQKKDIFFMQQALGQARKAIDLDEVPVGAVVVNPAGEIVARAHNRVNQERFQGAHAECLALNQAGQEAGDWRLEGHWLYVTLQPCAMCLHLILLSRVAGVVWGATSPLFGFDLDKLSTHSVYKIDTICVVPFVCAAESATLLQLFFQKKRRTGGRRMGQKWSGSRGNQKAINGT